MGSVLMRRSTRHLRLMNRAARAGKSGRSWTVLMSAVQRQQAVAELLTQLAALDQDAIAAYGAAIERVHNPEVRSTLQGFMADHQRHVVELAPHVRKLCPRAATGPDIARVLAAGKVMIANLAGDRAILFALSSAEDDTNAAYTRGLHNDDLPPETLAVVQQHFTEVRQHQGWMRRALHPEAAGATKADPMQVLADASMAPHRFAEQQTRT